MARVSTKLTVPAMGALLACAALALTACGPSRPTVTPTPTPSVPLPSFSVAPPSLPAGFASRLDGSTATIPLGQAVLKSLVGTDEGMTFNQTDPAYQNLIKGTKDLILVTYPSAAEQAAADKAGVKLDIIPVVKDALVFLANTGNPVTGLTQQQVKDIYTGKTTDWSQVGGNPGAIVPYQRQVDSGSQTLFLKLAMAGTTPMNAPAELRPTQMSGLVDSIAAANTTIGPNALGYSVFYYATQMYLKNSVKLLGIDGVVPSAQTVSNGTYPYGTYYYAVMRSDTPADSPARAVVNWLLGDAGQRIASAANYVPLSPNNIVTAKPTYLLGANAQNTTESSGTGGTQRKDTAPSSFVTTTCTNEGYVNTFTATGHPDATKAVTDWIAQRRAKGYMTECYGATGFGDLISVIAKRVGPASATSSAGDIEGTDGALFDAATGRQLKLSDLFYDKVNYISFLNDNLLNQWTNQELQDLVAANNGDVDSVVGTPFTGIPADYGSFAFDEDSYGLRLEICFPDGNPFTKTWTFMAGSVDLTSLPIRLPQNLSPYGLLWQLIQPPAPGKTSVILPVVTTSFPGPGPNDAAINAAIQAAYAKASQVGSTEIDLFGTRLSVVFWSQPATVYWQPGVVQSMTTIDLTTGQPAPFGASDIPAQWWKGDTVDTGNVTVYDNGSSTASSDANGGLGPTITGYQPPAGATYRNVRRGIDGLYFDVVEPSGRVLSVVIYGS